MHLRGLMYFHGYPAVHGIEIQRLTVDRPNVIDDPMRLSKVSVTRIAAQPQGASLDKTLPGTHLR